MKAEENTVRTYVSGMSVDNTNERWRWMAPRRTRSLLWRSAPNLLTRVETTAEEGHEEGHEAPMETAPRKLATSQINARSLCGVPCDSGHACTIAKICLTTRKTAAVSGALSPRSEVDHAPPPANDHLPRRAGRGVDDDAPHGHPEVRGQHGADPRIAPSGSR